jgi:hypothetical protein
MPDAKFTAWSFSRWEAHSGPDGCPLFAKLKFLDKIEEPGSPAMARGNEIHKKAATFLMGGEAAPFPPELAKFDRLMWQVHDMPDDMKVCEQQWGFTETWKPTTWFGKQTWFRSIIDCGLMYEDFTGEVIDFKTGRRYDVSKEQVTLFGAAFLWKYPQVQSVTTRLWYLDEQPPNNEYIDEVKRSELPAIQADWERKVQPMFSDTTFLPRPGKKCAGCFYSASQSGRCRFG